MWETLAAALAIAIALAIFWQILELGALRFDVPLIYGGDALAMMYTYDSGVHIANDVGTGMPFGTSLDDAPMSDGFNLLLIRLLDYLFGVGAAYNLFLLASVVLVGIAAYLVGRRFGLSPVWAGALSILFNVLPFHHERMGHLFFTNYAAAAVGFWLALDVVSNRFGSSRGRWYWPVVIAAAMFCGSCGIYYAFFSCLFIALAWLIACCNTPSRPLFLRGLIVLALIAGTVFANLLPSIVYQHTHGNNNVGTRRLPADSEVYGLKMAQMVLPLGDHRIGSWAKLRGDYVTHAPLSNENETATLGMLGVIGLFLLLALPFLKALRGFFPPSLNGAGALTWIAFAYATIGGFGAVVAFTVLPAFRGLNRISVFFAFVALLTTVLALQKIARMSGTRYLGPILAVIVVTVGVLDMTPASHAYAPGYALGAKAFDIDRQFSQRVEKLLVPSAMVFQLPFISYPEAPARIKLANYELLIPVLHAPKLRWTFGAIRGREESAWLELASSLPLEQLVPMLKAIGFEGITVNIRGYADEGRAVRAEFAALGFEPDVISGNGTSLFYRIPGVQALDRRALAVAPRTSNWTDAQLETSQTGVWSHGDAEISIGNIAADVPNCRLALSLGTMTPRKVILMDNGNPLAEVALQPGTNATLSANIPLTARQEKHLTLHTDTPPLDPHNADGRAPFGFYWHFDGDSLCRPPATPRS